MQAAYFYPMGSAAITVLVLRWLLSGRLSRLPLDQPNLRSLHAAPVPRSGGIGIMAGILVVGVLLASQWPMLLLCTALLSLLSFIDDLRGLTPALRLAIHVIAALAFAIATLPHLSPLWLAFLVVAIVWVINLYNFMDGSDGLAGGMTLFGFLIYAVAAWHASLTVLAVFSLSIAASALAFLFFNFHPARIFMGDVGSVPLGFLGAAIGILGWQAGAWPGWFPILVFSPFIADATVTLLRRLRRGERVWEAHHEHYYQKLVRSGKGHRWTAAAEYSVMALCGVSALWGMQQSLFTQMLLLLCWALIYACIMVAIERRWREFSAQKEISGQSEI
jgi:UDP-GlcNAc:undecaprenyl-phosphate/decaprenyl-phosphate GlcNAc-1-phosphate transferase